MGKLDMKLQLQEGAKDINTKIEHETKHAEKKDIKKDQERKDKTIVKESKTENNPTISNTEQKKKTATKKADVNVSKENNIDKAKKIKQVFSFRATLDDIATWKAYATATGNTMETIGTAALNEYLNRHKLKGVDLDIFEAMKSKHVDK